MQPNANTSVNLTLTFGEVQGIIGQLEQLPFNQVAPLINKIANQVNPQINPKPAEEVQTIDEASGD